MVIAKANIYNAQTFRYNVLPVGMIETFTVLARNRLNLQNNRILKNFIYLSTQKLTGKDG
jgi:hypothetical protein